jgi:hypothetical protein
MTAFIRRGMGAALILTSTAQFTYAEVTAQEVWADWKTYMSSVGYEVTGTESTSGDTLTVSDVSMSMNMPEDDGTITVEMGALEFTESGDGTVAVAMPSTMPMRISGQDDGKKFDVVVSYAQSGYSMIVSGDPDAMNYNYSASQVKLALDSISVDGKKMPADLARVDVTMTNVTSSTQMKLAEMRDYSQRMSVGSLNYDIAFSDPESEDKGALTGSLQELSFQGAGIMPLEMSTADFQAMLASGFAFDGAFEYASGNSSMNAVGDGEAFSFTGSSKGGKLGVKMDATQIAYDASQKGISINVTTNQLPFPISVEMAETGFSLKMPVAKSKEKQDFSMAVKLANFTMSEMIWSMFDPGAVLPRDPATIALDVSGKAKVLVNFLDPKVAETLNQLEAAPGELHALDINELVVSAAGSKLTGKGSFTFDNNDLTTFDGMPAPSGVANLKLVGANGLMDKLIQMGLMSDSDAMGARMMMGMLAVPGDDPDTLKSKIEINGQGHISANGQRIK